MICLLRILPQNVYENMHVYTTGTCKHSTCSHSVNEGGIFYIHCFALRGVLSKTGQWKAQVGTGKNGKTAKVGQLDPVLQASSGSWRGGGTASDGDLPLDLEPQSRRLSRWG